MSETVTEKDCDLRMKPVEIALAKWDSRLWGILIAILGVLIMTGASLFVQLMNHSFVSQAQAAQTQTQGKK